MTTPDALSGDSRPKLPSFVRLQFDKTRERWVLQGPERLLVLDDTSREILERATGEVTIDEISKALATEYDAPLDVISHDVIAVFKVMAEKNFLEFV